MTTQRYEELRTKITEHEGPWTVALNPEEREEYSRLKKIEKNKKKIFTKTEVIKLLNEIYKEVKEGKNRAFILKLKRKINEQVYP